MPKRRPTPQAKRRLPDLSQPPGDWSIEVQLDEDGMRVDAFLASHITWKSRTAIQKLIKEGRVFRNGRGARAGEKVKHLERLAVIIGRLPDEHPDASAIPLTVLFEDASIIVLNKQAGVLVHPVGAHQTDTLMSALHARFRSPDTALDRVPRLCHRLDKDTSGVWVVALTERASATMARDFQHRRVTKSYFALVRGEPAFEQRAVEIPIGDDTRSPIRLRRWASDAAGDAQPAWTDVEVLERFPGGAAVMAQPRTGRTHQIRVHLAAIGHPILHDPLYGPEHDADRWEHAAHGVEPLCDASGTIVLDRQALHAWKLTCTHPVTGKELHLEAPPTPDLERTMTWLRAGGLA